MSPQTAPSLPEAVWEKGGMGGRALGAQAKPVLEQGEGHKEALFPEQ